MQGGELSGVRKEENTDPRFQVCGVLVQRLKTYSASFKSIGPPGFPLNNNILITYNIYLLLHHSPGSLLLLLETVL